MRTHNPYDLPPNLPVPTDDGACDHLSGMRVPSVQLPSTAGGLVDLAAFRGRTVVYCYPRTGKPGEPSLPGWDEIPGARGCTPQSCAFRDHYKELQVHGVRVFGVSTQSTVNQQEAATRLKLPYALLSDVYQALVRALHLPTFTVAEGTFIKRLTLIIGNGRIEHVFYPIFPPDQNAGEVVRWLQDRRPQT